jgi:hypothetical protein
MRPLSISLIICILLTCPPTAPVAAADLKEQTRLAYERYEREVTRIFLERVHGRSTPSAPSALSLRDGQVVARPGNQDGIIAVPGGLVHHWIGTIFIVGVTLHDALRVSYAYDDYHTFYKPVVASQLLGREDNTYRVLLRLQESAGGMSAVLDVRTRVQYFYPSSKNAYSLSSSDEIREVKNAGSPQERHLPAGRDSGYLWRAATLNRLVERDDGLLVEMETLGLSRSFPPLLGWIIEPVAKRIGRRSVELSLQEFRSAVRARKSQNGHRGIRRDATVYKSSDITMGSVACGESYLLNSIKGGIDEQRVNS